ncbi:hypothetical protein C7974DRAFT_174377 [Boeremia exigua]|uniref:uncharacterized protein n=1 Tax=Boeremia exigua TaxID=749465 RepID=UPI001E8D3F3C|nr:uncharacterized protein C7974DRAFT_174377 [Boeremia exigua]KAH6633567.1 hypothetical protein C7974DRAFT_174377 [Boeremia exigua]
MSAQHSLPGSPSRRVLGDLIPRAMNTPSKAKNLESSGLTRAQSPLKQLRATSHTPQIFANKENASSTDAFPQGRKRSIAEVDDAEKVPTAKMVAFERDGPQDAIAQLTSAAVQRHTSNNPVGLADPGSPTERATPTPSPSSPSPQPQSFPDPRSQIFADPHSLTFADSHSQPFPDSQKSFSEFLDYGLCASQQSEHGIAVAASKPAPKTPTSAPAPKSRAQLLRTRLTFAKYKVRTNQVSKPTRDVLSDYNLSSSPDALRTHGYMTSGEQLGAADAPAPAPRVPHITISSPARPVFVKANLDPFRPIGALGQPPVSFAPPVDRSGVESRVVEGYDVGSSPPVQSVSPSELMGSARGGESKHARLQRLKEQQWRETSGTQGRESSGAQGNAGTAGSAGSAGSAAKGLMELMSGRR